MDQRKPFAPNSPPPARPPPNPQVQPLPAINAQPPPPLSSKLPPHLMKLPPQVAKPPGSAPPPQQPTSPAPPRPNSSGNAIPTTALPPPPPLSGSTGIGQQQPPPVNTSSGSVPPQHPLPPIVKRPPQPPSQLHSGTQTTTSANNIPIPNKPPPQRPNSSGGAIPNTALPPPPNLSGSTGMGPPPLQQQQQQRPNSSGNSIPTTALPPPPMMVGVSLPPPPPPITDDLVLPPPPMMTRPPPPTTRESLPPHLSSLPPTILPPPPSMFTPPPPLSNPPPSLSTPPPLSSPPPPLSTPPPIHQTPKPPLPTHQSKESLSEFINPSTQFRNSTESSQFRNSTDALTPLSSDNFPEISSQARIAEENFNYLKDIYNKITKRSQSSVSCVREGNSLAEAFKNYGTMLIAQSDNTLGQCMFKIGDFQRDYESFRNKVDNQALSGVRGTVDQYVNRDMKVVRANKKNYDKIRTMYDSVEAKVVANASKGKGVNLVKQAELQQERDFLRHRVATVGAESDSTIRLASESNAVELMEQIVEYVENVQLAVQELNKQIEAIQPSYQVYKKESQRRRQDLENKIEVQKSQQLQQQQQQQTSVNIFSNDSSGNNNNNSSGNLSTSKGSGPKMIGVPKAERDVPGEDPRKSRIRRLVSSEHDTSIIASTGPNNAVTYCFESKQQKEEWWSVLSKYISKANQNKLFAIALEHLYQRPTEVGRPVPSFLQRIVDHLFESGYNEEGIFRLSANQRVLDASKEEIETGIELDYSELDTHVVACLLKLWVRNLPEPLLTWKAFDAFVAVADLDSKQQRFQTIKQLVDRLPLENRFCMYYLMRLLTKVADNSATNKMTPNNISIVFATLLLKKKDASPLDCTSFNTIFGVVECFMTGFTYIFSDVEKQFNDYQEQQLHLKRKSVMVMKPLPQAPGIGQGPSAPDMATLHIKNNSPTGGYGGSISTAKPIVKHQPTSDSEGEEDDDDEGGFPFSANISKQASITIQLGEIVKQGYLTKKGAMRRNWTKRWFVLKQNYLFYFKTSRDKKPKGIIQLVNVGAVKSFYKPNCMAIKSLVDREEREFLICATSASELEEWIKAISNCCEKN
ncbi:RhoGEF domain-containing protein [Cavenderia fasciculata]|uniref:RhoGEF domain-containing protein n=1 Tax=Cavenderia fasciculata TaxID=261658 RepID=F4PX77_CACFS|nr:RhoGEF domain-containing protein [Cavenderia fasciculata]EGG19880.1 RhoGEF domain-containing protein [Cavenderia fasciculata]|eukprot:XP_004366863.1 RhoGEF domain-containing protein [Cavenderia fasciculata]